VTVICSLIACSAEQGAGGDEPDSQPAGGSDARSTPALQAPTGPLDSALADRGQELFRTRACTTCHTVGGGRLVGPDLSEVTERREFGWILSMIQNPDSMIRADSLARQLFAEYMTPMANQGITAEEARALYEYLRREDSQ
jgi:mono/diheme cytochrome c family protein